MNRARSQAPITSLDTLRKGARGVVVGVDPGAEAAHGLPVEALRRLIEIGFVAGEPVEVVATSFPNGDPIAVRVGATRFALRKLEARAIWIEPEVA
jgi:ferrous iron transport protein A